MLAVDSISFMPRSSRFAWWGGIIVSIIACLLLGVPAMAAEDNCRLGVITADNVNVRTEPSTESLIIGTYDANERITILGSKGNFFRVNYSGEEGYVTDEFTIAYNFDVGKVNAKNVALREGSTTESNKVATLDKGTSVNVYGEEDGFYRVTVGTSIGFISSQYVTRSDDSSSSSSDSSTVSSDSSSGEKDYTRTVKTGDYSEEELYLIAQLVYAEGNGNSSDGLRAIATVVYNRIQSSRFPNSVEGVIYQSGQFSVVNNRSKFLSSSPSQKAIDAVYSVFVDGELNLPPDVMYFKSGRLSKSWGAREYYQTLGSNMFYT